jgi:hypothetical protein
MKAGGEKRKEITSEEDPRAGFHSHRNRSTPARHWSLGTLVGEVSGIAASGKSVKRIREGMAHPYLCTSQFVEFIKEI